MPHIFDYRWTYRDRTYDLELDNPDEETTPARTIYRITARSSDEQGEVVQEERVDLRLDFEENSVQVAHNNEPVFEVPLDTPLGDEADAESDWWTIVEEQFGGQEPIEALIDNIPAIDPVIGCIIRGSVSATIGQLIRCWRENREIRDFWERVQAIARCMGANSLRILGTAMWRIGKCVIGT